MATLNLNYVNLVGRVGQIPDVKVFESGSVLTKLNLAVSRRKKDEDPDWFSLEFWGKQAEIAADYVQKGSLIGIEGELKLDEWNDKATGVLRSKPVIRVNRLELLVSANNSSNSNNNHSQPTSSQTEPQTQNQDDEF
ncbi:single-stranded DNA-binding protein [Crocosphaera chwakensis]|uniref:Single-stranded DNA-binding protein n=1 Tax=Crocosphaera chwakensis CCY0110 TaxID=391612 RepID=A3IXD5_9CHRO|nr:single-stranded DNA-binding protein [Crocosphaera chwakensis]EAZ88878.1 single-strand binding protein [Crocosphaera chwakensis CCY0110]